MIHLQRLSRVMLSLSTLALGSVLQAQQNKAPIQDALGRFAVAHDHNGSWCLGYIYIYPDSIAYETTWPATYQSHSFTLRRSDLKDVSRWSRKGQSFSGVELKSGTTVQHFWWLANEQDVVNGRAYQKDPSDVGDPDQLITAIRDPASLTTDPGPSAQPPAPSGSTTASQLQQLPDSPLASGVAAPTVASPRSSAVPETRFPVAHAHALLYCVGYLYISPTSVRYEVVQPAGDKKHSFNLHRTEIQGVGQWILTGRARNAAEVRTAQSTYHFWLLPTGSDLENTPYKQWNANSVAPVGPLISALKSER